jgi:hypothetical protein
LSIATVGADQAAPEKLTDSERSKLELIMVGACLAESNRKLVIETLDLDAVSQTGRNLIGAIIERDTENVLKWFHRRGVVLQPGQTLLHGICQRLNGDGKRSRVNAILSNLEYTKSHGTTESLRELLQQALEELDK